MSEELMVEVDGIRYRIEDAERLGLLKVKAAPAESKAKTPQNKARTTDNKGA
jgi:hypothetical protein